MFALLTAVCAALTAYAYVGYPAMVSLIARRRHSPPTSRTAQTTPSVSLIISAFNERDVIAGKLQNAFDLDYPTALLEVIVVTDGSADGTEHVATAAAGHRAVVLHDPARSGKAAAMARGVARATGAVVVFSDANNLFPADALRQLIIPLGDPEVGVVTGAKAVSGGSAEVSAGERAYWKYESFIKKQESKLGCCTGVIGELLAVRRELVPALPDGLVNDDFYIAMQVARAGHKVAYAPAALSLEPAAVSLEADGIRRRRMSAGRWQSLIWWRETLPLSRPGVVWQVLSHKYLRLLLPFTMAGAFIGSICDVLVGKPRLWRKTRGSFLAAQILFYALAAGANRVKKPAIVKSAGGASRYLVRSNFASAQGLLYYCRNRSNLHLWERVDRSEAGGLNAEESVENGSRTVQV